MLCSLLRLAAALRVCRVVSTRCPCLRGPSQAISAVSRSLISPSMIMSGILALRIARSAQAKVTPAFVLTRELIDSL